MNGSLRLKVIKSKTLEGLAKTLLSLVKILCTKARDLLLSPKRKDEKLSIAFMRV